MYNTENPSPPQTNIKIIIPICRTEDQEPITECKNEFEYVCEEEVPPPPDDYGIPLAEPVSVLPPAKNAKYGDKIRGKRQTWSSHPGLDGLFINVNNEVPHVYGAGREDYSR